MIGTDFSFGQLLSAEEINSYRNEVILALSYQSLVDLSELNFNRNNFWA